MEMTGSPPFGANAIPRRMALVAPKPLTQSTHEVHEFSSTRKWIIAFSVMLGTILEVLDYSIVNVSLPHMQGSFSASVDEIAWVVTSYLVAAGIMIPMTGWIAERFGRKRYFMASVTMFVVSSALCGVAQSLPDRVLPPDAGGGGRGDDAAVAGHPWRPFPPREQAMAMAVWGIGMMVAPDHGADHRRLYHRRVELALELLHQRADRHAGGVHGVSLRRRPVVHAQPAARRLARHRLPVHHARTRRNRARSRRARPTGSPVRG